MIDRVAVLGLWALVACLPACASGDSPTRRGPPAPEATAEEKIALLTVLESFCVWTELSHPFEYLAFAFQIDGRLAFYQTESSCGDFASLAASEEGRRPVFGERVWLYGGSGPTHVRRADGRVWPLRPAQPIGSFFRAGAKGRVGLPAFAEGRNPALYERECRSLLETAERDACLRYVWEPEGER